MLLGRRLVKILDSYIICKGEINRSDFINYITNDRLWPRINYYLVYRKEMFKRRINNIIDDCIAYEFIMEEKEKLKVIKKGRDYIKLLGFFEEFLKRRKRTVVNIISLVISLLIAYLIAHFGKFCE